MRSGFFYKRSRFWVDRGGATPKRPKKSLHSKKILLCVWWDIFGVIYFELLPDNQMIDSKFYCKQLERLNSAISIKRPWIDKTRIFFHQDNARPHIAKSTIEKIREIGWKTVPHPPYSPDLAPSDYHLFRNLELYLRGNEYKTKEEIELCLTQFFSLKPTEFYRRGIMSLTERWKKVIENNGEYITFFG
jgi:[histone H3]-lysine36 N-dimethyltransferase SETMAR